MAKLTSTLLVLSCLLALGFLQVTPGVDPIAARIMPKPKNYTHGDTHLLITDPCGISYQPRTASGVVPNHVYSIIGFYSVNLFSSSETSCSDPFPSSMKPTFSSSRRLQHSQNIVFDIYLKDANLTTAKTVEDEYYSLEIHNTTYWSLSTNTYVGLLRGLETYSQLFVQDPLNSKWYLRDLPLSIQDQPDFPYRGLMIDSARHFLSMDTILATIDSMMFNKLNVLHWHITDTESFPLPLKSFPNITKYGAYSKKSQYSFYDIQEVVEQALFKGIQVIPEVDSPGHSLSWAKSPQFAEIGMSCKTYQGQLDPTLPKTYEAVRGILKDMNQQFPTASYVHFGGDEVNETCWNQRPSIAEYMTQNNITSYMDLENYYRATQKAIWRSINATKPAIYWANSADLAFQPDDVIQWWGTTAALSQIANFTNKIILSNYDSTYLDVGNGSRYGSSYGSLYGWSTMNGFNPRVSGIKGTVIGGESSLWTEMSNDDTQLLRVWTRNSAFSERLWNTDAAIGENFPTRAVVSRMVHMYHRLRARGIPASPVTVEACERDLSMCYDN